MEQNFERKTPVRYLGREEEAQFDKSCASFSIATEVVVFDYFLYVFDYKFKSIHESMHHLIGNG